MEAWLSLNDESLVYKGNGSSINLKVEGNDRLKSLFDQLLAVYLSEVSDKKGVIRSLPVLTSSGQPLDLFKLYWIVREKGGYDLVSSKNLWGYVAGHCGLDFGAVAFVKLAYVKYLSEFDHWLMRLLKDGNMENGEGGVIQRFDLLSNELETRFRRLLSHKGEKEKDTNLFPSEECEEELICKVNTQVDFEMFTAESVNKINDDDNAFLVSTKGVVEKVLCKAPDESNRQYDDDEKFFARDRKINTTSTGEVIQGDVAKMNGMAENENLSVQNGYDSTVASGKSVIEDVIVSRKRKREPSCFSGMLDWLNHAAKHSNDPEIGQVPDSSKWTGHTTNEFWSQVLLVREALLKKNHSDTNAEESNPQKKPRMHPSMYEEEKLNNQHAEKLRCSKRVVYASQKHVNCPCCNSCSTSQNKETPQKEEEEDTQPDMTSVFEVSITEKTEDSVDQQTHREVPVGPLYQAEVPEWTGVISESDSKWLGTRMWPPEVEKTKSLVELDPIGKGRKSSCGCPFPQSVECIRFHIADKRSKLKLELGRLFFRWRFDRMGEEVALSWTDEEEERFKNMVRSGASTLKSKNWKNYKKLFPSKTRNMLVSYYFNVFLIKRRSYQNRVTPKDLDSDDDEIDFGCVGSSFGDIRFHAPISRSSLTCTQNEVCTDLE
ncbi:AT-rich interactive domain-containing protein 2 isoform X1 [Lycium barbarum]|uniref:AT-rich interactive domain-containing protein 2 isoform X1 n=1 Tax=Lycium barbarum TaxID=112863 RepID=UPI00293F58D6|nr:AT-rich interactive domain-containing protein 2 isoform X1 [Lycium barbarum]